MAQNAHTLIHLEEGMHGGRGNNPTDLPGLAPVREGKREGLKVGTILSKSIHEAARGSACRASCLSARDLFQPFEKIVPDCLARAGSEGVQTMRACPSRQHPCRGLRIYIRTVVEGGRAGGAGTSSSGRGHPRPRGAGRCPLIASSSVARTKIAMEGSERASH